MEERLIEYEKKRIAAACLVGWEEKNEIIIERRKELKLTIEASFYERTLQTKDIVHEFPAPTFLEWLFKINRKVTLHADVKDVLQPPFFGGLKDWQKSVLLSDFKLIPWRKK